MGKLRVIGGKPASEGGGGGDRPSDPGPGPGPGPSANGKPGPGDGAADQGLDSEEETLVVAMQGLAEKVAGLDLASPAKVPMPAAGAAPPANPDGDTSFDKVEPIDGAPGPASRARLPGGEVRVAVDVDLGHAWQADGHRWAETPFEPPPPFGAGETAAIHPPPEWRPPGPPPPPPVQPAPSVSPPWFARPGTLPGVDPGFDPGRITYPGVPAVSGPYSPVGTLSGPFSPVASIVGPYPAYTGPIPYVVQPVAAPPGTLRWAIALAVAVFVTTVAGIGVGWLLFARDREATARDAPARGQPAAELAAARPVEAPAAPRAPERAAPTPAEPRPVAADVVSLDHPLLATVTSPLRGEIAGADLESARRVVKDEKLFELRHGRAPRAAELAARVAELQRLAREDPVYEAFLARARDDYRRAQRSERVVSLRAPVDGDAAPAVSRGRRVEAGDTLATISDARTWTATATLPGGAATITRAASCSIAAADGGSRAPCRIERVLLEESRTRVTASIAAADAPWLLGLDQKPRLLLAAAPPPD